MVCLSGGASIVKNSAHDEAKFLGVGVTLQVEPTLFEKLLTEIRGFSLSTKFCGVVVCLSVRGTRGPDGV